ncbi:hypothetical protein B0H14DRAFT_3464122 [Mycena olivaceomarginata]|nr:hypothetical protein B0H14DRAFT_3464122 [Mycena olivaceomarginata]
MSLPAGEEVDLGGTLPSGTTNKGAALDEDDAGDGNDTPEDRAQSVSQSPAPRERAHCIPASRERATSGTVSPRSEDERTVSPRSEDERTHPPLPPKNEGKSPPPSTTDKGLASGDGVDAGADEEPDRQEDNDDSGSNKDGNEDSNENDDKDSNEDEDEDEDDNNSNDSSGEHNPGGQSYRDRHPGAPVQPPRRPRAEKGKSTAEKNTAVLKGKELKATRKILDEKVGEFEDLLEARAAELSEQLNIPLREVKQWLGHVTRYTDGRDYNEFSAKVWKRMKEMNVGKQKGERIQMPEVQKIVQAEGADAWSADDLVQLKKDYLAYQESKSKGTRPSNSSAAKDAGAVASNISKEMDLLQHRTGARAFGVLAGGHANDTISPTLLGDPANFKFLQEVYKIDPVVFLVKYDSWTNLGAQGITAAGRYFQRTPCLPISLCAGNKTNNPNVKMNYKDYKRVIQGGLGWTLVGWPEGATFVAPSNFKAGGAGHIVALWQRLKSGACRFEPTDPALRAEILARPSGKRSRKAKGSTAQLKSAEEEPDAAETDADTDPEPAAGRSGSGRRTRANCRRVVRGRKSAGGKKAKQAEGKGKEKDKTKEKKQKGRKTAVGRNGSGAPTVNKRSRRTKKKRKPFAHSTGHRSAEFVPTDDDKPEGSTAGGNAVAGGSSGTGGSSGGRWWWQWWQCGKRVKDLKAAAEAKQRMEADIAADIASGKMKPKTKRKRQPKSAKEIDEDDYDNEDSS